MTYPDFIKRKVEREAFQIYKRRRTQEQVKGVKLGDSFSDYIQAEQIVLEREKLKDIKKYWPRGEVSV